MTFISPEHRSGGLPKKVEQMVESPEIIDPKLKAIIEKLPKNYTNEEDKNAKSS